MESVSAVDEAAMVAHEQESFESGKPEDEIPAMLTRKTRNEFPNKQVMVMTMTVIQFSPKEHNGNERCLNAPPSSPCMK